MSPPVCPDGWPFMAFTTGFIAVILVCVTVIAVASNAATLVAALKEWRKRDEP